MPNRWERVNGVLTPKIARASVAPETTAILTDYSKTDDFGYSASPTTDYTVTGTWSADVDGSKFLSGVVAGNSGGLRSLGTGKQIDPTKKVDFKCRLKLTDADTELFAYIGLAQTAPTDADPPVEADDYVGFNLVETTLNTNWQCITATNLGTTETTTDSGIVVDLNTFHTFEILGNSDGSEFEFKIDGNQVAVTRLTVPTNTALFPTVKVTTGNTVAKGIVVDVMSVVNTR